MDNNIIKKLIRKITIDDITTIIYTIIALKLSRYIDTINNVNEFNIIDIITNVDFLVIITVLLIFKYYFIYLKNINERGKKYE